MKQDSLTYITDCTVMELRSVSDGRGQIVIAESIPFLARRVFYIRNAPPETIRGYHALRSCEQVFIPVSGFCLLKLEDARDYKIVVLNTLDPKQVYVPPLIWRTLYGFSPDSIVVVLASGLYDKNDYYRDREEWRAIVKGSKSAG